MEFNIVTTMLVELVALAFCLLSVSQCVPVDTDPRIVNGTDVDIKDYPYMVSIQYGEYHLCGGTIIDEYNILTAGHCTTELYPEFYAVLAGSTVIKDYNTKLVPVENIVRHESYTGEMPYNQDVAILQLSEPLEFNEDVQPITLPKAFDPIPEHSPAVLTGWGSNSTEGLVSDTLQEVDIIVYSDIECETLHNTSHTSRITHVCAGIPEGGKGQCSGDSGGPLVVDGVQIGIVSWSIKPCTRPGYPGVYTKVSTYIDFINCNLKKVYTHEYIQLRFEFDTLFKK